VPYHQNQEMFFCQQREWVGKAEDHYSRQGTALPEISHVGSLHLCSQICSG
jgi:hypothetical protein